MAKLPAFQFYPGDWLKNANLGRCSKAAKGMWIDMLAIAFDCDDRGVFATNGVPWTDEEIAESISGDTALNLLYLKELLLKGVAKRNENGAVYSERMIKDEVLRKARSDAGKAGGRGHAKQNESKQQSKTKAKSKQIPEDEDEEEDILFKGGAGGIPAADIYAAYPRRQGRGAALKAIQSAIERGKDSRYLFERAKAYAVAVAKWPKPDRQYIPLPATWFNQERYDDDPEMWERTSRTEANASPARIQAPEGKYAGRSIEC